MAGLQAGLKSYKTISVSSTAGVFKLYTVLFLPVIIPSRELDTQRIQIYRGYRYRDYIDLQRIHIQRLYRFTEDTDTEIIQIYRGYRYREDIDLQRIQIQREYRFIEDTDTEIIYIYRENRARYRDYLYLQSKQIQIQRLYILSE